MATIVLKLFELFQPQYAYFGQKDAQQAAIVARMIKDFHLPLLLRVLPTLREADGLAMSSRNSYLAPETRAAAPVLYQALLAGQRVFESLPPEGPAAVSQAMREVIATTPLARLDYAEIRDPETFLPLETLRAPALLLLAVSFGSTRLLDNFLLRPDGTWDTGLIHV
jgi:pantoate--beta-alanine ligase